MIFFSAVKQLKYLITINRINVIVNSRLIAHFNIFFLFKCSYQHGKVDRLALFKCYLLPYTVFNFTPMFSLGENKLSM